MPARRAMKIFFYYLYFIALQFHVERERWRICKSEDYRLRVYEAYVLIPSALRRSEKQKKINTAG